MAAADRITEADLVVLGGGPGGAAAALGAAEAGLSVIVVEKTPAGGGNCVLSFGNLLDLAGPHAIDHLVALCSGGTPTPVLAAYLDGLRTLPSWLEGLGATLENRPREGAGAVELCWPGFPGAAGVRYYTVRGDGSAGRALWQVLECALAARAVPVLLGTAARELVVEDGRVVGARTTGPDGITRTIRARRGVVLATGGFENHGAMCDTYLTVPGICAIAHPGNTGDGIAMAQGVGAALWHMSAWFGFWSVAVPGHDLPFALGLTAPSHIVVDAHGRRYVAELGREAHDRLRRLGDYLPRRSAVPTRRSFAILDEEALRRGPLSPFATPNSHTWSRDNSAEITAGWIRRAPDAAALAQALAIDWESLMNTLASYNRAAREGRDDPLGRPGDTMAPLDLDGPLYGIEIAPGVATTSGGPRRDPAARVLDEAGLPIPGLYATGGCGSIWGQLTEHGGGLTDALVFGRIAAAHAGGA